MELKEISISQLARFFQGGCDNLALHKETVNALNVFPVPDGDTGINMYLTINSAVKNISDPAKNDTASKMAQNFSMGALMGARGNSGVILSQIFRGFSQGIDGKKVIGARDFALALQKGKTLAYKSVMKPVEGTILTVFKDFADAAMEYVNQGRDIIQMLEQALLAGEKSLANTPNLLPVLKQAGVVDAGGKGILIIMEGGLAALKGEPLAVAAPVAEPPIQEPAPALRDEIEFIYCTEVMIYGKNPPEAKVRELLAKEVKGDSLIVVGMEEIVKIHFHSNAPWGILEIASRFGELRDIKIDNMLVQHNSLSDIAPPVEIKAPENCPELGVLAICVGEGISEVFSKMGAEVISGGQTMNPSAEEILNAMNKMTARKIIILPNNSNIILTAQQAEKLTEKTVKVMPTKYVTQGIGAMLNFDPEISLDENYARMEKVVESIVSGEVTFAVRDSQYEDREIKENDILALMEGKIVFSGPDLDEAALALIQSMVDKLESPSIISLFYGNELEEESVQNLVESLELLYDELDVEYYFGGQSLYYYLVSVE